MHLTRGVEGRGRASGPGSRGFGGCGVSSMLFRALNRGGGGWGSLGGQGLVVGHGRTYDAGVVEHGGGDDGGAKGQLGQELV